MKMKKLVAILIVLGLTGVANAAFFEDFESLDPGFINGQNGWTDTGFGAWYRGNYPATVGTAGIGQAGKSTDNWMGYAGRDISGDAGASGYVLEVLTGGINPGNNALIIGDYRLLDTGEPDSVANPADHLYIQNVWNGYSYVAAYDDGWADSTELAPGSAGDATGLGWYRLKWELDFSGTPTGYAYLADADDDTGEISSAWTLLASKTLPDGLDTPAEVVSASFHIHKGAFIDNFSSTSGSSASFAGDFDGDGDVDGDDFLAWQNGFPTASGAASSSGDADGDGDVDGDDFLIWQNQFPSPGVVAMTPEPASLALMALGGGLALLRRRC